MKLFVEVGSDPVDIGCDSVLSPTIDSKIDFETYMKSIENVDVSKGAKFETENTIDLVLSSQYLKDVDYFVVESIDNVEKGEQVLEKIKKLNKDIYISESTSKDYLYVLYSKGLIDYLETKYTIIKLDDDFFKIYDDILKNTRGFEFQWVSFLYDKYTALASTLMSRLSILKTQVEHSFSINNKNVSFSFDTQWFDNKIKFINDDDISKYINDENDIIIVDKYFCERVNNYTDVYCIEHDNRSMSVIKDVLSFMEARRHFNRVVVIGGVPIQDIASLACCAYNNGVGWVYFPTTLLAMSGGFGDPSTIYINTKFLATLNLESLRSGLIEILKVCMIGDVLDLYIKYKYDINNLVKLSLIIKKSIAKLSAYDSNVIDYGHTIGHVIEVASGYTIPHGVASLYGMLVVNKLFNYDDILFENLCKELIIDCKIKDLSNIKNILLKDKTNNFIDFVVPRARGNFHVIKTELTDNMCELIKMYILRLCD
jgi:3-dehydroquinate synthetase